ncbi:MAG: DNA methyltransferase [Phycisphaerales bacterium]
MAKKRAVDQGSPELFERHERALGRRLRRQRALFIPRYLREAAANQQLSGSAQDTAHAIAVRWAELESSGELAKHKETSIDTQFLDQLFCEGLGYSVKTQTPTSWQLEHKYAVPGIGTADAALGDFPAAGFPTAVIELKDAQNDIDRDKSNGRTAVQQCWDYLNALPDCPWGIVSNFSTIRLYHRGKGNLAYEEFTLQELRERPRFNEFYCLFERGGLLRSQLGQLPRAAALLERTQRRQKEVGDDLYRSYQFQRLRLIEHLQLREGKPLDEAIRVAQKLLDRIIFIAFCEDRGLLPEKCLERAATAVPAFSRVTNPRWHNFLGLFHAVDKGGSVKPVINAFNGGLFAPDAEIDELDLDDEPWTVGFKGFGDFDFSEEVNVEVLGHLFERSITELEKLRVGGLFALKGAVEGANGHTSGSTKARPGKGKARKPTPATDDSPLSKMPKSAQRKRFGIYYTPPAFTGLIVERTVDALVRGRFAALAKARKVDPESREAQDPRKLRAYWTACLECLKSLTICDPACGSGAFLIRAYDAMDAHYKAVAHGLGGAGEDLDDLRAIEESIPDLILTNNLYGVDLSREGVEITQLALWIRSARAGRTLMDLSRHIVHGNSLVTDPAVDPHALDWAKAFPHVFGEGKPGGFDCVIGNPPWEQIMLHDREFFALTHPAIATAVNAADRDAMIDALPKTNPDLHAAYQVADAKAIAMLRYVREGGDFPLTGKGRTNLYMAFAERAKMLVAPSGMVGLLVPSGIATDDSTKEFFNDLMDRKALVSLYDFENRNKVFEDVDGRFKFSAIVFHGGDFKTEQADFVFFAHDVAEVAELNKQRHIALTAADMKLLNPNTKTCPIFRTRRDANLTRAIYKRVPILIDANRKQGGNPWGITFKQGLFNQTSDAKKFTKPEVLKKSGYALQGNRWMKGKSLYLPLYEAKMVQAFDHRAASVVIETNNWMRQGQTADSSLVEHANPEYAVISRWWVKQSLVDDELTVKAPAYLGYKRVTSATNQRTMIAAFVPKVAAANSLCLVLPNDRIELRCTACLLGNLNSFVFDYVTRQKTGAVDLNFFIVEQLPTLPPDTYADKCPWSKRETLEHWISERVLKLSCTAEDMIPLAKACEFKGSRGDGVHIWKEQERASIRAELDAAYFLLYGIERDDAEYMLSTFTGTGFIHPEDRPAGGPAWVRGSIGEAVLDAYDALAAHGGAPTFPTSP